MANGPGGEARVGRETEGRRKQSLQGGKVGGCSQEVCRRHRTIGAADAQVIGDSFSHVLFAIYQTMTQFQKVFYWPATSLSHLLGR